VTGLPSNSFALTNCVYLHESDFTRMRQSSSMKDPATDPEVKAYGIHVSIGGYVFNAR
jgi:hypothetical protein